MVRPLRIRTLLLAAVIVALVATVGFALQRETAPKVTTEPVPAAVGEPVRALSAEEEAYAVALWPIHSEVKLFAVTMTFAGLAYKTEDHNPRRLEAKVQPLTESFRAATGRAQALAVPASLRTVHDQYLEALALYENAATEMVKATRDGRDEHLIEAQGMSFRAAENLLKVGDVLWPGEYKPN